MYKIFSFLFKIKKFRGEIFIYPTQVKFIKNYESSIRLLNSEFSVSKLKNPFLKEIVGDHSVITSYSNPDHKNNRQIAKECLYSFTESEINLIQDIVKLELKRYTINKSFDGNAFCHKLAYDIATSIFIGNIRDNSKVLFRVLRGLQWNVPYGLILFSRAFYNGRFPKALTFLISRRNVPNHLKRLISDKSFIKSERLKRIENTVKGYGQEEFIHDHLSGILLAAQETFACSISWLLFELLQSNNKQEEIKLSLNQSEKKAKQFIDYILKKYPPLWLIIRDTSEVKSKEISVIKVEEINNCPHNAKSLTFGAGERYCLGASLAKIELLIILKELVNSYEIKTKKQSTKTHYSNLMRCHFKNKIWIRSI